MAVRISESAGPAAARHPHPAQRNGPASEFGAVFAEAANQPGDTARRGPAESAEAAAPEAAIGAPDASTVVDADAELPASAENSNSGEDPLSGDASLAAARDVSPGLARPVSHEALRNTNPDPSQVPLPRDAAGRSAAAGVDAGRPRSSGTTSLPSSDPVRAQPDAALPPLGGQGGSAEGGQSLSPAALQTEERADRPPRPLAPTTEAVGPASAKPPTQVATLSTGASRTSGAFPWDGPGPSLADVRGASTVFAQAKQSAEELAIPEGFSPSQSPGIAKTADAGGTPAAATNARIAAGAGYPQSGLRTDSAPPRATDHEDRADAAVPKPAIATGAPHNVRVSRAAPLVWSSVARPAAQATAWPALQEVSDTSAPSPSDTDFPAAPPDTTAPAAHRTIGGSAQTASLPAPLRPLAEVIGHLRDGQVEVRLRPEELGTVRMQLTQSETGLVLQVSAERAETLEMLRRHADILQRELADAGFGSVDIGFGGASREDRAGTDRHAADPQAGGTAPADMPAARTQEPAPRPGLDIRV